MRSEVASAGDLASAVYDLLVERDEASEDIARLRRVESAAVELVREPFGRLALRSFYALREALGTEPCEVCGLRYEMGQHYGARAGSRGRREARVPRPCSSSERHLMPLDGPARPHPKGGRVGEPPPKPEPKKKPVRAKGKKK